MLNPTLFFPVAFGISFCLTFFLRTIARRTRRFGYRGDGAPVLIPQIGGVAIVAATSLPLVFHPPDLSPGLWTGAAGMALTGLLDDHRPLSPLQKLCLQGVAVALAVAVGLHMEVSDNRLVDAMLTGGWLIWMCNAFNVLDMMDGLSAGVGTIAALGLGGIGLASGGPAVAGPAAALSGALAGFLPHNLHPARIYMGDTGSLFTGFLLGGMAVAVSRALPAPQGMLCPLLVLGVPLFESVFLSAVRTAKGRPAWRASRDHVAQRLVQTGCSIRGAVGRMYAAGAGLALLGVAGAWGPAAACRAVFAGTVVLALWAGLRLARVDMEGDGTDGRGEGGVFSKNWAVHRLMQKAMAGVVCCAGGRLLDVGCGRMPYRRIFAPRVVRYVGMERDRGRYRGGRVDVWGDATALPFAGERFETVLSTQVLEHVPEPARAVAEMARVLSPGGRLILTAPHIWGIHEPPHDYFRYTPYGLQYLAERAGLAVVEVRALAGFWVTAGVRFCDYLGRFERGILALPVRIGYLLIQAGALALDRLHRVEADAWNFLMIARKPLQRER